MLTTLAQAAATPGEPKDWQWLIAIAIAIALALLIAFVGRRYVHRVRRKAKDASEDQPSGRRLRRKSTVIGLIVGIIQVLAWFTVVLLVLNYFNVPLGPLIASAGVIGVALGFGAQTVVKDTLAGLFMALEGQINIGDVVDLQTEGGPVSGTVEGFTIRVTSIRQFDGTLSVVPNGNIQITQNKTRGWGRAIVDIRVALSEDSERVREVLDELLGEMAAQEPYKGWLRERPEVLGVTQLTDVAQVIRVVAETAPNHRIDIERELRGRMAQRIAERGIRVPPVTAMPGPSV
jgi:small conductance mechanosensitive channel